MDLFLSNEKTFFSKQMLKKDREKESKVKVKHIIVKSEE